MYISWNWLSRHVDLSGLDPNEIGNRFTMSVAELEGIEEFGATYDNVVAGKIVTLEPHPDSDKLQVLKMDAGSKTVTIVSGAPNVAQGQIVALALPGVVLEGVEGKPVVESVTLRGVPSEGVTCSEMELGLSADHSGVLVFPEDTPVGTPLTKLLPVHDFILEIDNKSITHRPDLWGHRGIAREIAALVKRPFNSFGIDIPQGSKDLLKVSVTAPDLCPRYTALQFGNVKVAQSPLWLKLALSLVGVRPISNIVDITNFVMLDVGNPTHAFDARFVEGSEIVVRRANPKETLTTLDGEVRPLLPDDVVIADAKQGVALGGVMGGENSEIRDDTSNVVLECAVFEPSTIRRTSARLGLRTEASARFEKGLDHLSPLLAATLFARLMRELLPESTVDSKLYDVAQPDPEPTVIELKPEFIRNKLGVHIDDSTMKGMLQGIEFVVDDSTDTWHITVPTFRATRDVTIPQDIVEEIGRLFGYDNIPESPIMAKVEPKPMDPAKAMQKQVRLALVGLSYAEVMSYSFDSVKLSNTVGYDLSKALELRNPISADMPVMRRSLFPNMLTVAQKNSQHRDSFRVFEVGRVFDHARNPGDIPHQERHVAGLIYERKGDNIELFRRVKGHIERILNMVGRADEKLEVSDEHTKDMPWTVPGKTVAVKINGRYAGWLSVLNPVVRNALKLKGKCAIFELDLEVLVEAEEQIRLFEPLPKFPAIQHDLSVLVKEDVSYESVETVITQTGGTLLSNTELFAIFRGNPIPEGWKSLSFHLAFRSPERTLKDHEVTPLVERILERLQKEVGGEIRS